MKLNELAVANISETALTKLREAERAINGNDGQQMDVYLIALTKK